MKQENLKDKLTEVSKESKVISTKRIKNNLLIRSKKEAKGITLIALVITIIVLLILAGVTIATLLGDNGIITKATTAKDKTREAGAVERVQVEVAGSYGTDGTIDIDLLNSNLKNNISGLTYNGKELSDSNKIVSLPATVELDGYNILIDDNGNVSQKELMTADKLDESLKNKEKVQYVTNYGIDIDGDGSATDDWEVFYVEDYKGEDNAQPGNQPAIGKRIFLIASDYVRADTEELQTAADKASMQSVEEGSNNEELKADYVKYWSSSSIPTYDCTLPSEATSDKEACTFPNLFEFSKYNIKNHNQNTNSKCAASLLCTGNWSSFVKSQYAEYATGGPTVEMWMNSWNKRHLEKPLYYSESGDTGYYVGPSESPTTFETKVSNDDPLYFPHNSETGDFDGDEINETCVGYWLASPSASDSINIMRVGNDGWVDENGYDWACFGVRPVVCLKSGVKLVKSDENLEGNAEYYKLAN